MIPAVAEVLALLGGGDADGNDDTPLTSAPKVTLLFDIEVCNIPMLLLLEVDVVVVVPTLVELPTRNADFNDGNTVAAGFGGVVVAVVVGVEFHLSEKSLLL
jgi:hypothetical protein